MNDDRLNQLLRDADPYDDRLTQDLGGTDLALLDELVSTPDARLGRQRPASLRRSLLTAGVAAAAVTALIAVPTVIANHAARTGPGIAGPTVRPGGTGPATQTVTPITYAAAVIRIARANPRVIVTAAGWKVRNVEGFSPNAGQITFQLGPDHWRDVQYAGGSSHENTAPQFEVTWYPADQYESYRQSRADKGSNLEHVRVLGQDAQLVGYSATDQAVMLPPEGKVFLEMRGGVGDRAAFKTFLAEDLAKVTIRQWLAAMPASVVTADNEGAAAAADLVGVPLPPGFDQTSLGSAVALDPYQFGARVAGAVACGWLDEWTRARTVGDIPAQQRAVVAMATSHNWKVLNDMNAEGDYPEVLWEYADRIAAGLVPQGYRTGLGCP